MIYSIGFLSNSILLFVDDLTCGLLVITFYYFLDQRQASEWLFDSLLFHGTHIITHCIHLFSLSFSRFSTT